MVQAEEGMQCHGSREIHRGHVLEQDATGSAAEDWETAQPLPISSSPAWHCHSTVCFFLSGAGLMPDEGEQNPDRTLAPAENALSEH